MLYLYFMFDLMVYVFMRFWGLGCSLGLGLGAGLDPLFHSRFKGPSLMSP